MVSVRGGRQPGTFAIKELVYAYAMWISAEYHLKVIQAYDRLVTDGVAVHEDKPEALLEGPPAFFEKLLGRLMPIERDVTVSTNG